MKSFFLKNLAFLLLLNFLIKPFWILGIDRTVQNIVGATDYGLYFSLFNFSYLFFIFLDLGITNYNNRNIARNNDQLSIHFGSVATLKLLLGLGYGMLVIFVGHIIGYKERQLTLLIWIALNQFLLSFVLYLRSNVSGLLLFKTDSILSVLDKIIMIVIVSVLLWTPILKKEFTIEYFIFSQTVAYLITFIIAFFIVLHKAGKLKFNWNKSFFISILKNSIPFALLVLVMSLYSRMDSVLIERLLPDPMGEQQAGVFAQAYRLLDAGQNIAYLFAVLLLPLFSKMLKQKENVQSLIRVSFSLLLTGALIFVVSSQFFAGDLMKALYTRGHGETLMHFQVRIQQSAFIFKMLMWSFVAIASNYIFGTLLTANNNLKILNIIAFLGFILNFLLNFIFIPRFMAEGAAVASLVTMTFSAFIQYFVAIKVIKLNPEMKIIFKLILLSAGVALSGWLIQKNIDIIWWYQWAIILLLGSIFAVLLKLLSLKKLLVVLKERAGEA